MPRKHEDTARIGGPGASHENRREPEKSKSPPGPLEKKSTRHSGVSGGGGEPDRHAHDPRGRAGQ
jgi:hypothetical protein